MTKDYSEMSEAELVELQRKIEKELVERKQAGKPEKLPSQKPRVEKPKIKAPPFEQMSARFCRKCDHPIWKYIVTSSRFPVGASESYFFVKGQRGKPSEVTHCPKCKRKLSPGRLKFSAEIEEAIQASSQLSKDTPKASGIWSMYCVECGHQIGFLKNNGFSQFFKEGDRQKPISACPGCQAPLKEADDVDFNDMQRNRLHSIYQMLLQWGEEAEIHEKELAQLLEKIRIKKPASLVGVKTIIGVYPNSSNRDKTSLKELLAKCQDYCETNGLEVIKKLMYSYQSSDKELQIDKLLERKVGAIVTSMKWLTSNSHREAVKFVRELEQAGIHLEIIAEKEDNQG